ncbi:unnamed protein product [Tilletia controversa]|nr:unnamed protein product [Tilletia controversa]
MANSWTECGHALASSSLTALAFDPHSELLWAGTASGQVVSHYSPGLVRFTSFPATVSPYNPSPVKDFLIDDRNVYTLGERANSSTITRTASAEASIVKLRKYTRLVCAGASNGSIQLRDPRSLKVEHRLAAHAGGLIDMAVEGNMIYSVGWTVRLGHPVPDAFVKVHDIRTNRSLVPLAFAAQGGPALLSIHPKQNSTIFVTGPQGQFQVVDVNSPGEGLFFQTSTASFVTSMALSPSADFLAFGEADASHSCR